MVEVTVGIFLVAVGLMAVSASFDIFRTLVSSSSKRNVAAHVAEMELERLASAGWKDLVLVADPGTSTDPKDPRSGVVPSNPPKYRPDNTTSLDPLQINAANPAAVPVSRDWRETEVPGEPGATGKVYRFITKGTDPACGSTCPKRVTVAVTIDRPSGNKPEPVTATTVVSETQDKNANEAAAPPPAPPGPSYQSFYATDTQASIGVRQPPTVDHIVHETNKFPDLLVFDPPPNPNEPADPPAIRLFSQSYHVNYGGSYTSAGFPGGRVVRTHPNCDNYGDKTKVEYWVTPPLAATATLTGNLTGSIFAQIAGEAPGNIILCLGVYAVVKPLKADGSFDGAPTRLNGKDCSGSDIRINSDAQAFPDPGPPVAPLAPREIAFGGKFLGCNIVSQQIAAGHRIAIVLTVRDRRPKGDAPVLANDIPGSDAIVLYDHPDFPTSVSIETTTPMTFTP